jgi:hypothetical protein
MGNPRVDMLIGPDHHRSFGVPVGAQMVTINGTSLLWLSSWSVNMSKLQNSNACMFCPNAFLILTIAGLNLP